MARIPFCRFWGRCRFQVPAAGSHCPQTRRPQLWHLPGEPSRSTACHRSHQPSPASIWLIGEAIGAARTPTQMRIYPTSVRLI